MKKVILIFAVAGLVVGAANAKEKKDKKDKKAVQVKAPVKIFNNSVDSMSYALGVNVGNDFSKNLKNIPGGKINIDLLVKAFSSSMKGDSTLLNAQLAQEYFRNYITKAQEADKEKRKIESQEFLASNMTKEGVKSTASGLQYIALKDVQGIKPKATDTVKVHYTGTLIDGTTFDSSVSRGEPATFALNQVIPGWTEGLQLMSVGSKYKFFIPYTLGYGEQGAGQMIPPYSTLVFEVELLDIKPAKEVVTPAKEEPAKKATTSDTAKKPVKKAKK